MKLHLIITTLLLGLTSFSSYSKSIQEDSLRIVQLFELSLQHPDKSDSLNEEAFSIFKLRSLETQILEDTYLYNYSLFLFRTAELDSAMVIANKGVKLNESNGKVGYKSFKFHNILGSVYLYKNEHAKAVSEFQITIKILEEFGNYHQAALIKNNLANVFFSLHDYESSYKYSQQAYLQLKQEKDTIYLPSLTGVFAVSAIELDKIGEADSLANESLTLSVKYNNVLGLIVSNYCLGDVNVVKNKFIEAEVYFLKSLEISEEVGHKHFITLNKVGLLNTYYNLTNYSNAVKFGEEALTETTIQKNENLFYGINKTLGRSYFGLKDYKNAYFHINEAHKIYQKTATIDNKKAINDILVKYDTEKKEKEIANNKLVIAQDEIKLNKRKLWIIGLVAIVLILIISYFFYARTQKHKLSQLQKEEEQNRILSLMKGEEKERERISNELHDSVASSVTGIKIQLEHFNKEHSKPEIDKLVSQLSKLHEETRRISHNLMPISLTEFGLIKSLENYCKENTSALLKINFINLIQKELDINDHTSIILYRVIQELVNNVKKHADSPVCFIQTSLQSNQIIISIEDEGIGLDPENTTKSQGIISIKKRVSDLKGEVTIDSKTDNGTLIIISIPL